MHKLVFGHDTLQCGDEVLDPILLPLTSIWERRENLMKPSATKVEKTGAKPYNVANLELVGHGHTTIVA